MNILLAVASTRLSYGGPAVSVTALSRALAGSGCRVGLWSPDGSVSATAGIVPLRGTFRMAVESFGRPHVVHDNGIWLPHNHQISAWCNAAGVPRLVSPRGMLSPWARRHKQWKKSIAWRMYQKRDLDSAAGLHATSDIEKHDLFCLGLRPQVTTIPNGLELSNAAPRSWIRGATRREALFFGRLYPVKGLPNLIEAWDRVRPQGWQLCIVGPDERDHASVLRRQIERAGLAEVVTLEEPVEGTSKFERLRRADLFVLPSLSESFGMAAVEAMGEGLPLITTTATPWAVVRERRMGWCVEPTPEALAQALLEATALPRTSLQEFGERARGYVRERFDWSVLVNQYLTLYDRVCTAFRQT